MADMFSVDQRSLIMSRIRSRGNQSTEVRFIRVMKKYGVKGWRRGVKLPGRPDFVFRAIKLAVFIDGDFWHGNPKKYRIPKSNIDYWRKKIEGNCARDRRNNSVLRKAGWRVLRIWESALIKIDRLPANARFRKRLSRFNLYAKTNPPA